MDISQEVKEETFKRLCKYNVKNANLDRLTKCTEAFNDSVTTILVRIRDEIKVKDDIDAIVSRLNAARQIMLKDKAELESFDPTRYVYVTIYTALKHRLRGLDLSSPFGNAIGKLDSLKPVFNESIDLVPLWKSLKSETRVEIQNCLSYCICFANSISDTLLVCDYDVKGFMDSYREGFLKSFGSESMLKSIGIDVIRSLEKNASQFIRFLDGKSPIGIFTIAGLVANDLADNPAYSKLSNADIIKLSNEVFDIIVPNLSKQQPTENPAKQDISKEEKDENRKSS